MSAAEHAVALVEGLGQAGVTVSLCYGPCGPDRLAWSVLAIAPDGQEFDRPYAAESFEHAAAIALIEAMRRRWI
jgi:hypothetical protein